MGKTVQELSIKVIRRLGNRKPQFKVLAVQASPCVVRSFTMGKVYLTKASFSHDLSSMSADENPQGPSRAEA